MRLATLAGVVLLVGCGPGIDPLIGSYTFTLSGLDTNTAPNTQTSTPSGGGTVAITTNATTLTDFVITLAQSDTTPCVLTGSVAAMKAADPEITIKPTQTCSFYGSGTTVTATITSGKAVVKLAATRASDTLTLDVAYSYAYQVFGVNFAGTGHRTYSGARR